MATTAAEPAWPAWQRAAFRFLFAYMLLYITPWEWLGAIPGASVVFDPWEKLVDGAVHWGNAHLFHVRPVLVPVNGSGDTSWAWAQAWLYLSVAFVAAAVWSVLDRKRLSYDRLLYWFRTIVRYYLASVALTYGIIKLFRLQMIFPSTSNLATPLGDLLPMRLSWFFIGYSEPYQFFSGAVETMAGLLLLYRRTVTLGLFAAMGAFLNVFLINVSYDVPVKLFSLHLLCWSVVLLMLDAPRLASFFLLNRGAPPTPAWEPNWARPWQRWTAIAAKLYLLWQFVLVPVNQAWANYKNAHAVQPPGPFPPGIYEVKSFVHGRDTIPFTAADTMRWKDVIFDGPRAGSVGSTDTLFWQRYRRGYFRYKPDTTAHTVTIWRTSWVQDSTFILLARYERPDTATIRLHTVLRGDSLHVELVRVARHFQLTERQFHWLSEYNR